MISSLPQYLFYQQLEQARRAAPVSFGHKKMGNARLVAAVVHEVITAEDFATIADLSEAVKCRCARLRIPYDSGTVTEALALVERTRPILALAPRRRPMCHVEHVERVDDVQPLTKAEAADIWERLTVAFERQQQRKRA